MSAVYAHAASVVGDPPDDGTIKTHHRSSIGCWEISFLDLRTSTISEDVTVIVVIPEVIAGRSAPPFSAGSIPRRSKIYFALHGSMRRRF